MQRIIKCCLALLMALVIYGHGDSCEVIFAKDYTVTQNDALLSRPLLMGTMRKRNCELEELFNDLKDRACEENANLAHITKIKEPNLPWGNACYEIHAILYQCRGKMEYTEWPWPGKFEPPTKLVFSLGVSPFDNQLYSSRRYRPWRKSTGNDIRKSLNSKLFLRS